MQKESWEAFCFTLFSWMYVFFFYLFEHAQDLSFFFSQKYHLKIIP